MLIDRPDHFRKEPRAMLRIRQTPVASGIRSLIVVASVLAFSGCGFGGSGHTADPLEAGESLKIALEAWKSGAKSNELSALEPAILMVDPDWNAGAGLVDFVADQPARLAGYDVVMPVRLTLKTGKGRKISRTAVYSISTKPQNLIIRQEG
jgi:hypothetical protein